VYAVDLHALKNENLEDETKKKSSGRDLSEDGASTGMWARLCGGGVVVVY
jgi:hypothetical protein